MMEDATLIEIAESIPQVAPSRNYWFVRTNGGRYYNEFLYGGFVAIGHNDISLEDISLAAVHDAKGLNQLSERIKSKRGEEEKRHKYLANQLRRFVYDIKQGDIVIIPDVSSRTLYFGEVVNTITELAEVGAHGCPFSKRKRVRWLKHAQRSRLDAEFLKLIFSHHTVTIASQYASFIDRVLKSYFQKGEEGHLVFHIRSNKKILAADLSVFGAHALSLLDEFCEEENIENPHDYAVKVNVQSPGTVEITTISVICLAALGLILNSIAGGGFSLTYKNKAKETSLGVSVKSDGIIEKMRRFLNSKESRKSRAQIIAKALENMDVIQPDELAKLMEETKKTE